MVEEKNDPITLCKCLTILVEMIKCSNVQVLTPNLLNLKENFLNQCMSSRDLLTQSLAIEATAQFCILDRELAKENLIRFFLMVIEFVYFQFYLNHFFSFHRKMHLKSLCSSLHIFHRVSIALKVLIAISIEFFSSFFKKII